MSCMEVGERLRCLILSGRVCTSVKFWGYGGESRLVQLCTGYFSITKITSITCIFGSHRSSRSHNPPSFVRLFSPNLCKGQSQVCKLINLTSSFGWSLKYFVLLSFTSVHDIAISLCWLTESSLKMFKTMTQCTVLARGASCISFTTLHCPPVSPFAPTTTTPTFIHEGVLWQKSAFIKMTHHQMTKWNEKNYTLYLKPTTLYITELDTVVL